MKTGRKILTLLIVILLVIVAVGLILRFSDDSYETYSANLYFINQSKTSIYPETRDIKYEHKKDLPELILDELVKGTPTAGEEVIPKGAGWYLSAKSSRAMVDFSNEFLREDSSVNLLAAYAVVKSLCGVNGISAVKVTVDGEELVGADATAIGYLTSNDIDIEADKNSSIEKNVKLYFAEEDGKLTAEWRRIGISDTTSVAEYLVDELIKGPQTSALSATLSPETKLISVEVTEGVAYVNMSAGFIEKNKGDKNKEMKAVYSVVNTLLELPSIKGVQFLIEGKKETGFTTIDLSKIFTYK